MPITGNKPVSLSHFHHSMTHKTFILLLQNSIIQIGGLISKLIIKMRKLKVVAATPAVGNYFDQNLDRTLYIWALGKTVEINKRVSS